MTNETSLPAKQRIWELDALRGLCILCMVAIHAFWDLSAFGGFAFDLPGWFLFCRQYGHILFILLSGLCATLASRSFQRGVYVFGAALVISYVTFFMVQVLNFPDDMLIWFGILHMLGVCMMLFPLFKRLPVWALAVLGIALLGGATAFTESTLAQIYKRRNPETGESYGGPAYYIEAALHSRPLAVLFALSLIATYAGGFNMLCSYNLQSTFSGYSFYSPEWTPWIIGGIVALLTGYCVMGGGKRIIAFASTLVPIMGGLYVLVALVVIVMNVGLIPQVFGRIFSEAFDFQAIFAGFTGSAVMQGVKRGLFSNEAGVGSAPNAAASANVSHPVKQGLVQMLSVFLDTLVICSATAFMLLCSGVEPAVELQGAPYVQSALAASFGTLGPVFITVAMVLFAFTTLIGNLYYVDNALAYLLGHVPSKRFMVVFRLIAMGLIFLGAGLTLDLVWNLSDVLMGVMVLINIPVIAVLSRPAAAALRNYTEQRRAGKNPVFRAADIGLKEKTEYWN